MINMILKICFWPCLMLKWIFMLCIKMVFLPFSFFRFLLFGKRNNMKEKETDEFLEGLMMGGELYGDDEEDRL